MRNRPLLYGMLAAVAALAQETKPLHDEDPLATMAVREKNWRQLEAFAGQVVSPDFRSPADYLRSIEPLRQLLRGRIGYPAPGFTGHTGEPRLEKSGEDAVATYYRIWIPVAPELETYGLYLVPKNVKLPAPLVISQHGGGGFPEMATYKGGANYKDQVRGAVAEGYLVFAPLQIQYPFGDRNNGTPIPADVRARLDEKLRAKGTSLAAIEMMKLTRALDALLKRKEVDPSRVAMIGLSYGGFYTLYAAALDPRIRVAVASCSFKDYPEPGTEFEKQMRKTDGRLFDMAGPDLVKLICPRPLQVQSGIHDKLLPIEEARRGTARVADYYGKLGLDAQFEFQAFDGGHEFRGDIAWQFLRKHLGGR